MNTRDFELNQKKPKWKSTWYPKWASISKTFNVGSEAWKAQRILLYIYIIIDNWLVFVKMAKN